MPPKAHKAGECGKREQSSDGAFAVNRCVRVRVVHTHTYARV